MSEQIEDFKQMDLLNKAAFLIEIITSLHKDNTPLYKDAEEWLSEYENGVKPDDRIQKAIDWCDEKMIENGNYEGAVFASHGSGKHKAFKEVKQFLQSLK